jgi:hypothetical protein
MLFVQDSAETRLDLLLADTPYDVQAIRRGQSVEVEPGATICVCSPEDLVIYKLVSTRLRDHEDAASVVRRQGDKLIACGSAASPCAAHARKRNRASGIASTWKVRRVKYSCGSSLGSPFAESIKSIWL